LRKLRNVWPKPKEGMIRNLSLVLWEDDNHKLSRKLVQECQFIAFSQDRIQDIALRPKPKRKINGKWETSIRFGKSVSEAGHYQLRKMPSYKCTISGRKYIEVQSKYSCGSLHDRNKNSAIITLRLGLGMSLERVVLLLIRNPLDLSMGRFNISL